MAIDPAKEALFDKLYESGWLERRIYNSDGEMDLEWTNKGLRRLDQLLLIFRDAGLSPCDTDKVSIFLSVVWDELGGELEDEADA